MAISKEDERILAELPSIGNCGPIICNGVDCQRDAGVENAKILGADAEDITGFENIMAKWCKQDIARQTEQG